VDRSFFDRFSFCGVPERGCVCDSGQPGWDAASWRCSAECL